LRLGVLYEFGLGVKKDYKLALEYYEAASNNANLDAIFNIARLHEKGRGVEKSLKKSYEYNIIAARKGHTEAQFKVAKMYEKGIGVESSLSKAKYWLKKLANDGDKRAEKILKTIN
jgi:hypothetical protein